MISVPSPGEAKVPVVVAVAKEKIKEKERVRRRARREMAGTDHVRPVPLLRLACHPHIVKPSLRRAFAHMAVRPLRVVPAGPHTTIRTPWSR